MNTVIKEDFETVIEKVKMLSKKGQYGEAFSLVVGFVNEAKEKGITFDWISGFICGWEACDCCDDIGILPCCGGILCVVCGIGGIIYCQTEGCCLCEGCGSELCSCCGDCGSEGCSIITDCCCPC